MSSDSSPNTGSEADTSPSIAERLRELPPSSKFIYKTLERCGRMTQKKISEETLLSTRTTRYGLKRLEEEGFVDTSPAVHDARQTCYELSDEALGKESEYANDVLVEADWVKDRLEEFATDDPSMRLVEVDSKRETYDDWHIPGATRMTWEEDIAGQNCRGIPDKKSYEEIMGEKGITEDSTVVLYGNQWNWFAAYAYWMMTYYGHDEVYLMNGGKNYWDEGCYDQTCDTPDFTQRDYDAGQTLEQIRAYRDDVKAALRQDTKILDVRSPSEFRGEGLAPPGEVPQVEVGGHIPSAEAFH
ncbi:MAG: rhodanese-like domain-containing protein [Halobacteria archaeon]|nr:rhodanese-like domain-containing protein [Halobacteria archaeon]